MILTIVRDTYVWLFFIFHFRIHGVPVKSLTGQSSDSSFDHQQQNRLLSIILRKISVIYRILVPIKKGKIQSSNEC